MKTQRIVNIWFVAFAYAVACCILSLVAADAPAAVATVGAFGTAQFWVDLLTPIVGPLLTAGVKKILPNIPVAFIPVVAIVLGVLANGIGTVALGGDVVIWKAVALSLAGIGVRELQNNFRTPTPTP